LPVVEARRTTDGVTRLTLNRPDNANALNDAMVAALSDALATAARDGTRLLVLARGRAMGAGADLFAACSRRVAAPGTQFRMPGLAFGILLGTRRLAARIGADAAREVQNATRGFDATEAHALGFASAILEEADWPAAIDAAATAANTLTPEATATLFDATVSDTRAEDMAALVASAARPGLKARIQAYRESLKR
jgi:enoyl-CoA hydratase/carnithine racemase